MPRFFNNPPKYKRRKSVEREWKNFTGGLNLLLRETELKNNEYAIGTNIMLKGAGVPIGRWGTTDYFSANNTGTVQGFASYNSRDGDGVYTREILALTDE